MSKGFWMAKGTECLTDGEAPYDKSSTIEPKRTHPWFLDPTGPELFPNKKQAVETSNNRSLSVSAVPNGNLSWENTSSFQSVSTQLTDQLFGTEPARNINFGGRNIPNIGAGSMGAENHSIGNIEIGRRGTEQHFGNDASIGLTMSHTIEDPGSCLSYGGIRKVKINQVKDSDSGTSLPKGHLFNSGDNSTISFGGYHEEPESNPSGRLISSYDLLMSQSSVQQPAVVKEKELALSNTNIILNTTPLAVVTPRTETPKNKIELKPSKQMPPNNFPSNVRSLLSTGMFDGVPLAVVTPRTETPKNKIELKPSKKMPPNNFPSNVRSLLSTGMLDGVPVKYISWSREKELHGIIKGSGYLCSCQLCNFSKQALNAYEFERHAGCKTKHPNNHIFFENGKTIYAIVQELRSTPQNLLFDVILNVTGSPINQKAFNIWKESFQAATRELQRIYGKDEMNPTVSE